MLLLRRRRARLLLLQPLLRLLRRLLRRLLLLLRVWLGLSRPLPLSGGVPGRHCRAAGQPPSEA